MDAITDRPVVLIGMMGVGKTTVGRVLAERLGRRFVDLDEEVEAAEATTIPEIFETAGEQQFRAAETRQLEEVLGHADAPVVAAGGGVVLRPENRRLLAASARVVWLEAPLGLLLARIGAGAERPLLAPDPTLRLADLLEERKRLYSEVADQSVVADGTVDDVVEAIMTGLAS